MNDNKMEQGFLNLLNMITKPRSKPTKFTKREPIKSANMEAYYFRETFNRRFLVPEKEIKAFDKLMGKIETGSATYELKEKFQEKYWKYLTEGELYDIKLIIENRYP